MRYFYFAVQWLLNSAYVCVRMHLYESVCTNNTTFRVLRLPAQHPTSADQTQTKRHCYDMQRRQPDSRSVPSSLLPRLQFTRFAVFARKSEIHADVPHSQQQQQHTYTSSGPFWRQRAAPDEYNNCSTSYAKCFCCVKMSPIDYVSLHCMHIVSTCLLFLSIFLARQCYLFHLSVNFVSNFTIFFTFLLYGIQLN